MDGNTPVTAAIAEKTAYDTIVQRLGDWRGDPSQLVTLEQTMPLLLRFENAPLRISDQFPFEPFFRTNLSRTTTFKTARQIGKSLQGCARMLLLSWHLPNFITLVVTPLFEQARRLSAMYVSRLIADSPFRRMFVDRVSLENVLHRTFTNGSQILFSYAYLSADRNRGIFANQLWIDEIQDMRVEHLPVLDECLSARPWKLKVRTGTPKSLENAVERSWEKSSQAEWMTRCDTGGCNHWNVAAISHDLLGMIGPMRDDIGRGRPATVCAKCRKPLDTRRGQWYHFKKENRWTHAGYHIPQAILPMHNEDPEAWPLLLAKLQGLTAGMTPARFLNEICGESTDTGTKLVSLSDLQRAACLPWRNDLAEAAKRAKDYPFCFLAIDWGGGGEKRISYTVMAVLAPNERGGLDCLYGHRVQRLLDFPYEVHCLVKIWRAFGCQVLVHDQASAGIIREQLLRQIGLIDKRKMVGVLYHGVFTKNIAQWHEATEARDQGYLSLHKTQSLAVTCDAVRAVANRFFQYDFVSDENPGLLYDFTSLVEDRIERGQAGDIYTIIHNEAIPDDFANAINIGSWWHWRVTNRFPDLSAAARLQLTPEVLRLIEPELGDIDWSEVNR